MGIVQARLNSSRFPGKVLEKFHGKPVVHHVLDATVEACGKQNVVLATSSQSFDDSLATFAKNSGWNVYRGSLNDVWSRYCNIVLRSSADWIIRICADSPLMSASLIQTMMKLVRPDYDLVTNTCPRTFPRGQSVEILNRRLFLDKKYFPVCETDREHVTPHLYRISALRILNYQNPLGDQSKESWSVEEPGDIERLEKLCRD